MKVEGWKVKGLMPTPHIPRNYFATLSLGGKKRFYELALVDCRTR